MMPTGVTRTRLAILVLAPVVVCGLLAFAALTAIGMMSFLSAMGHGSLTREEALPMYIVGGLVALAGTAGIAFLLERRTFGPGGERTAAHAALAWRTRAASLVLIIVLVAGGPPLVRELIFRSRVSAASAGADPDGRWEAMASLSMMAPSPRAFDTLRRIAFDVGDEPYYRAAAIVMLASYPDAKPVLLSLAQDAFPEVRAEAGAALPWRADDDATWAIVERLTRDDESPIVRKRMLDTLSSREAHPARTADRTRLLKELSTSTTPDEVLSAARGLGAAGYDAALAIIMDVNQLGGTRIEAITTLGELKNERALELLRAIVEGRTEPGFIPTGREVAFRAAASGSIGKLAPYEEYEFARALFHEERALFEVEQVVKAQSAYRDATGFVDARLACLELPATCVPGRDRDESLLGPALVSLLPRLGYARQFHPGPAAPRDQVSARKASPSSAVSFAYVAVPEEPFETGIRAFCADDTGQICFTRDGKGPALRNGRCPESVPALTPELTHTDPPNAPRECKVR